MPTPAESQNSLAYQISATDIDQLLNARAELEQLSLKESMEERLSRLGVTLSPSRSSGHRLPAESQNSLAYQSSATDIDQLLNARAELEQLSLKESMEERLSRLGVTLSPSRSSGHRLPAESQNSLAYQSSATDIDQLLNARAELEQLSLKESMEERLSRLGVTLSPSRSSGHRLPAESQNSLAYQSSATDIDQLLNARAELEQLSLKESMEERLSRLGVTLSPSRSSGHRLPAESQNSLAYQSSATDIDQLLNARAELEQLSLKESMEERLSRLGVTLSPSRSSGHRLPAESQNSLAYQSSATDIDQLLNARAELEQLSLKESMEERLSRLGVTLSPSRSSGHWLPAESQNSLAYQSSATDIDQLLNARAELEQLSLKESMEERLSRLGVTLSPSRSSGHRLPAESQNSLAYQSSATDIDQLLNARAELEQLSLKESMEERLSRQEQEALMPALAVMLRAQMSQMASLVEAPARRSRQPYVFTLKHSMPVTVPLWLVLVTMLGYLVWGSVLFCVWEGWGFLDAFYFCYVSLTTIGFGDLFPGASVKDDGDAQEKLVICSLYLLLGMALIAMCFNLAQEEVVNKVAYIATKLGMLKSHTPEYP